MLLSVPSIRVYAASRASDCLTRQISASKSNSRLNIRPKASACVICAVRQSRGKIALDKFDNLQMAQWRDLCVSLVKNCQIFCGFDKPANGAVVRIEGHFRIKIVSCHLVRTI